MEKKERNIELTQKKLDGASSTELSREYRMTQANVNRIVSDTMAKYPELLQFNN